MANDYLRYKYYLITRTLTNYLFTAVKRIIASNNLTMKGSIRDAVNSEALLQLANELKLTPAVLTSILTAVTVKHNVELDTYITVSETIKTASDININDVFITIPKKDIAIKTAYNERHRLKMFTSPIVIPKTFYGGLLSPLMLNVTAKGKVDSTIKKAIKSAIISQTHIQVSIGNSLYSNIESSSEVTVETLLHSLDSLKTASQMTSYTEQKVIVKKDTAINTQHKQNNISQLRTTIIVLERARLVDYAPYTLQQLNPRTLQEMKYKGE